MTTPFQKLVSDDTQSEGGSWRPIETAPKDGTLILAVEDFTRVDDNDNAYPEDFAVVQWVKRGWVGFGLYLESFQPTHWMPLPAPPSVSDGDRNGEDAGAAECEACQRGPDGETPNPSPITPDIGELIERLKQDAVAKSEASRVYVQARYGENYDWQKPEQTVSWQAATALQAIQAERDEARSSRVVELKMTPISDGLPKRDELRGEQTILTYNEHCGTWDLAFSEAGWGDFDNDFRLFVTHWLDISGMWPGVTAQVAEFARDTAARLEAAEKVLADIAAADPVDLALDPEWPQRIARAVVEPSHD